MKQFYSLLVLSILCLNTIRSQNSNALNFDGIDDYVSTPLPSVFSNIQGNSFTIEAWIFSSKWIASFDKILFAQLNSANFVAIGLTPHATTDTNKITFYIQNGPGIRSATAFAINQWHHIAVTWNAATNSAQIYINGVPGFTTPSTFTLGSGSDNSMTIGSSTDQDHFFKGSIDELRIWDSVRTASEINANMNDELSLPEANLVGYYKFNQGMAGLDNSGITTLNDELNLNNGTLNNFTLNGNTSNWIGGATTLGVEDFIKNNSSVKLFPNPAKDFIQISGLTQAKKYRIYNIFGVEINNGNISGNEKIETKNLTSGLYFLKFDNANTLKFIKK